MSISLVEGQIVEATVEKLVDGLGAFLKTDAGVTGLLHVSDMYWSWRRKDPSGAVQQGQRIRVKVLEINPEPVRVMFGLKQLGVDPWLEAGKRYAVGDRVSARVVAIREIEGEEGPFVAIYAELEDGLEGVLLSTQMVDGLLTARGVAVGEEVQATIESLDLDAKEVVLQRDLFA